MDLSKAFDLLEGMHPFKVLGTTKVSAELFKNSSLYQCCEVKWNGARSDRFNFKNGVKIGRAHV